MNGEIPNSPKNNPEKPEQAEVGRVSKQERIILAQELQKQFPDLRQETADKLADLRYEVGKSHEESIAQIIEGIDTTVGVQEIQEFLTQKYSEILNDAQQERAAFRNSIENYNTFSISGGVRQTGEGIQSFVANSIPELVKFSGNVLRGIPEALMHPVASARYIHQRADEIINT